MFVILFMILSWGGPIGLGALLAGLGIYYWGNSHDRRSKLEQSAAERAAREQRGGDA